MQKRGGLWSLIKETAEILLQIVYQQHPAPAERARFAFTAPCATFLG